MKARIKFAKRDSMKFVGHLDIMRYFQKAIRRANIDIKYSEGYSPHQIMSFAAPLGVGLESEAEYFDIELNSSSPPEQMIAALNAVMADGIEVLDFIQLEDKSKNAMSLVSAADYQIVFRDAYRPDIDLNQEIKHFYEQDEIIILKKTKKNEKEVNIKPMIYKLSADQNSVYMQLATGSVNNLKPELVMQAFYQYLNKEMPKFAFTVKRLELYLNGK